jgi:hypothetical protein
MTDLVQLLEDCELAIDELITVIEDDGDDIRDDYMEILNRLRDYIENDG